MCSTSFLLILFPQKAHVELARSFLLRLNLYSSMNIYIVAINKWCVRDLFIFCCLFAWIRATSSSFRIAQVDSSASHQHHWCAKWNLPIGWTSMHIAKYILPLYIKIWPLRMLVKPDYIGTILIHQLLHFALNTLAVEWFFVCSACAHVWKQKKKRRRIY